MAYTHCFPRLISRRRAVQIGGLSLVGLTTSQLSRLRRLSAGQTAAQRRHNSCVFIFLFGGPSHIDLWDMKPHAPVEIRGEFQSIGTSAPGIRICEHLPRLARQTHRLCLLRSMTHRMNVHGPACSEIYSGRPYFGLPNTDQALPEDWPSLASLVMRYGESASGLPASIVLPWYTQFVGQDRRIAGQTGGRMGEEWNPFLVQGDPSREDFEVQGVRLPGDVDPRRFEGRRELRRSLEQVSRQPGSLELENLIETNYETAEQLIERAQSTDAFSLQGESTASRERYGETKFGQSLLLARRMVEAGISLVTVNWNDDSADDKVSPHWDTHHNSFSKLKDGLCPVFDRSFAAFLEDLDERGLLDTTLVVALGEFGRTPKIGLITQNGMTEPTGRDHWPHAFTALLAGGGVRGGQAYGQTNETGGYVDRDPVSPADLAATVLMHLGIDPGLTYHDHFQSVPRRLCTGRPVADLT